MKILYLVGILVLTTIISAQQASFEGYRVYKVIPRTEKDVEVLESLTIAGIGDFWNEYTKINDNNRIMVSPDLQPVFLGRLMQAGIPAQIVFDNVQTIIDNQLQEAANAQHTSSFLSYDWDVYHNLEDIENWLDELVVAYPDIVTIVSMGRSVQNRTIKGIKINYSPDRAKPFAVIEGTLHAREWISPATVTWMIKEFLTSTDPDVRFMAENLEWHIFPVVNPDGYVYTFTHHRMWRKNRSTASFTTCPDVDDASNGVDLNRNFDFVWMTVGASANPCLNTYAGPSAASEPETQAISQYLLNLRQQGDIIYYLSFHSFTQVFILPYSHVNNITEMAADNHDDLYEIAVNATRKLAEREGTVYRVGIAADVLYPMSGSSFDWVKYNTNASITYLIELRDMGDFGFLLPASQIISNNLEIMDAIIEMDRSTRQLGYYSGASAISFSLLFVSVGILFVNLMN